MSVWTRAFWAATLERMLRGFAIGMLLVVGIEDRFNVFDADWSKALGYGLGGGLLALLFSLAGQAVSGNGPSFLRTETVEPAEYKPRRAMPTEVHGGDTEWGRS